MALFVSSVVIIALIVIMPIGIGVEVVESRVKSAAHRVHYHGTIDAVFGCILLSLSLFGAILLVGCFIFPLG